MSTDNPWLNLRKLAAIDIACLGSKLIIAQFVGGALLCGALGIFVLLQRGSLIQTLCGVYLIALAINYVPTLLYAIARTKK